MAKEEKQETWEERESRIKKEFKEHKLPEFFKIMKEQNIEYFSISFNGAGDSGDFDEIYFVSEKDVPTWSDIRDEAGVDPETKLWDMSNPEHAKLDNKCKVLRGYYLDPLRLSDNYVWIEDKPHSKRISINDYIIEIVDQYLNVEGIDWYNNEGGRGTAIFEDGELEIDGGTYYHEENGFNFKAESKNYVGAKGKING